MTAHDWLRSATTWLSILTLLAIVCPSASAEIVMDTLNGERARYFARHAALPIILPEGEVPGDVYITPIEGFVMRSNECFSSIQPTYSPSALPSQIKQRIGSAAGRIKLDIANVASAMLEAGFSANKRFKIGFTDVTIRSISLTQLMHAIRIRNNCTVNIVRILTDSSRDHYWEKIPWILRSVIYARESYNFVISRGSNVGGDVKVSLSAALKRFNVPASLQLSADISPNAVQAVTLTTDQVFPVAYQPAFISIDHVEKLKSAAHTSLFRYLIDFVFGNDRPNQRAQDAIKVLRSDFADQLVCPETIYSEMTRGRAIGFDPINDEHKNYISNVGLLLAAGWELCR